MKNNTLEEILKKYFGLKGTAFLKEPKVYGYCCKEPQYRYMTSNAEKKYSELINLLYDINDLVGIDNLSELIDNLDSLTNGIE